MNLKFNEDGTVNYLLRTGSDFVKSAMPGEAALGIVTNGERTKSDFEDYPIGINHTWYFEAETKKVKE